MYSNKRTLILVVASVMALLTLSGCSTNKIVKTEEHRVQPVDIGYSAPSVDNTNGQITVGDISDKREPTFNETQNIGNGTTSSQSNTSKETSETSSSGTESSNVVESRPPESKPSADTGASGDFDIDNIPEDGIYKTSFGLRAVDTKDNGNVIYVQDYYYSNDMLTKMMIYFVPMGEFDVNKIPELTSNAYTADQAVKQPDGTYRIIYTDEETLATLSIISMDAMYDIFKQAFEAEKAGLTS